MVEMVHQRWIRRKLYHRPGSDVWQANIRDKRDGSVHRFSTGEKRKTRARQAELDWIAETEAREAGEPISEIGFTAAYEEFLSLKDVRPLTLQTYTYNLRVYDKAFGRHRVPEIHAIDIERFLKRRQVSAKTKREYLAELRCFFKWCRRHDYTDHNPTEDIKVRRPAKKFGYALTVDEARALLVACREPVILELEPTPGGRRKNPWTQTIKPPRHLYVAVLAALLTGIRRTALLGLRWGDVNFDRGWIQIPAERQKDNEDFRVPLHPALARELRAHLRGRSSVDPEAPVFGGIVEIKRAFKTALGKVGLPQSIRWHDLRHSYSDWLRRRVSQAVKDALMGHAPQGIARAYEHVDWDELVTAIGMLPDLVSEGQKGIDVTEASG